jgi:hypothetical protein
MDPVRVAIAVRGHVLDDCRDLRVRQVQRDPAEKPGLVAREAPKATKGRPVPMEGAVL